jgi:hypothetical protein
MMYVGMSIDLKVRGADGFTGKIIADAICTINLFAPPKNPQVNPADRLSPDYTAIAVYDSASRYYLTTVPTTGWAAGVWWFQGVLSGGAGDYEAWDYESFTLVP